MIKTSTISLLALAVWFSASLYTGSTLAPVILSGSVVKNMGIEVAKKYHRKDCPVCKGTGKYLSGDGIKLVDCGYCEPDNELQNAVVHPEVKVYGESSEKCRNSNCRCKNCKCKNCGCLPSVQ